MNVRFLAHLAAVIAAFVLAVPPALALAANEDASKRTRIIGRVPITRAGMTKSVYHKLDRLVPELRKVPPATAIRLECRYPGVPRREQDVLDAFMIAGRVVKYLRDHHKLNLDLWVSADVVASSRKAPSSLTFSVFATEEIDKLETIPVVPINSEAH